MIAFTPQQIARLWRASKELGASTIQTTSKGFLVKGSNPQDYSITVDFSSFPVESTTFMFRIFTAWKEYAEEPGWDAYSDHEFLRTLIYGKLTRVSVGNGETIPISVLGCAIDPLKEVMESERKKSNES